MKKLLINILILLGTFNLIIAQTPNIENLLNELPNVTFKMIDSNKTHISYELRIKQPLDHFQPTKDFFDQKVFLIHRKFDSPVILHTSGYNLGKSGLFYFSKLLDANQISVEHRFFGESKPDSLDYNYLNFAQVTADLHHVNELFKKIYNGKWISTGCSKDGTTTIMYRYFYPDDVDVSLPSVAPLHIALEDPRIDHFLDTVGSDICRNKIKSFQIRLLKNRDKVLPLLYFYTKGAKMTYNYRSLEEAFEYSILEYPFSFWQYGHYGENCEKAIPSDTCSLSSAVEHLLDVSGIYLGSDNDIIAFEPNNYQAATEMGTYGYQIDEIKDYLQVLPLVPRPNTIIFRNKMNVSFDVTLLNNVHEWLRLNGNRFIYIYGSLDPYTAAAVPPSVNVDAVWFFMKGRNHLDAKIRNMNDEERQKLISTLENWLSIKIENNLQDK